MANFNYTAGVKFQPFSFEEMLRPLAMYTQEYNAIEQAYGDLNTKANEIAALANETDDPITYQRYKDFENSLRSKADTMAKQGLDTTSRRQLLDMRSRFATDITPIQNAIQRRNMLAEEQRKALLQNPTLMFQRDFNTRNYDTSLDRFLENANYDYGAQYSGALLTQEVSKMASNLARELRGTSTGELDKYTNTFLKKYGLSSGEVLYAIQNPNDTRGSRALRAIYDAAVEKVPESLRNLYGRDIERYASQGFWSAIGKDELSTYENFEEKLKAKNKQEGKDKPQPPSLYFKSVGDTIDINKDKDAKELNRLSKSLQEIETLIKQGKEIPQHSYRDIFSVRQPNGSYINTGRKEKIENPLRTAWETLQQKYGTDDINKLKHMISQDIRKKADYNRSYILNRAEGDLMMKNLRDNLLSSIDDLDDADKVKLRIVKASDKKAPTKEEINKLFKDDRASISWNPVKKEYKIISDEGNYIIDGKSAFNNVLINTINGAMSINDYLNQLSDEYYQGEGNERDILNFNKGLNYAFGTLHSYYNTVNSEATKTDKNARIGN